MRSLCCLLALLLGPLGCSSSPQSGPSNVPGDSGTAGSGGSGTFLIDAGIQCVDAGQDKGDAGCTPSQSSVSFSADVAPLLSGSCSGEACHGSAGWSDYASITSAHSHECCDGRPLVVPGAPDQSYLVHKLTGHGMCMGLPMPKNGAPLPPAQMQTLYDWICLGAKND
jgi:hypothetical protein